MKKTISTILLLILQVIYADAQNWNWATSVTGAMTNQNKGIATDQSLNNYVCGYFNGNTTYGTNTLSSLGGYDGYLTKTDPDGNYIWAINVGGGTGNCYPVSVTSDPTGNEIYVAGYFNSTANFSGSTNLTSLGSDDGFIAKYNGSGVLVWAIQISGVLVEQINDLAWTSCLGTCKGSFSYVTGKFSGTTNFGGTTLTSTGAQDIFTACYNNTNGSLVWVRKASSTSSFISSNAIATDKTDNSIYVTGGIIGNGTFGSLNLTNSYTSSKDQYLIKYNNSGTEQWIRKSIGIYDEEGNDLCVDNNSNIYVGGTYFANNTSFDGIMLPGALGSSDLSIVKYNNSGSVQYAISAGGNSQDNLSGICLDNNGFVFVTGDFQSQLLNFGGVSVTKDGSVDSYIARINSSGVFDQVSSPILSASSVTFPKGITANSIGGLVYCGDYRYSANFGTTALSNSGNYNTYIAKLKSSTWPITNGSTLKENILNMEVDQNGNTYVTGFYGGALNLGNGVTLSQPLAQPGFNPIGAFIIKYNPMGQAIWARNGVSTTFGPSGDAIASDPNGGVYMSGILFNSITLGSTVLNDPFKYGIYLAKYDNLTGVQQWALEIAKNTVSGSFNPKMSDIITDAVGNVYLTGNYSGTMVFGTGTQSVQLTSNGTSSCFVAKYNNTGTLQWVSNVGYSNTGLIQPSSITLNGTDIFVSGKFSSTATFGSLPAITSNGGFDIFFAKLNSSGIIQNVINAGSSAHESTGESDAYNGSIYFTGNYKNTINVGGNTIVSAGDQDGFIAKVNANTMAVTWIKEVKGSGYGSITGVAVKNSRVFISGECIGGTTLGDGTSNIIFNSSTKKIFIERFDDLGTYNWHKTIDGINSLSNSIGGSKIDVDGNMNIVTVGNYSVSININNIIYSSAGDEDFFIEKISSIDGSFAKQSNNNVFTSVVESHKYDNLRISPNPSNGVFKIDFETSDPPKIEIYNLMGKLIYSTIDINSNERIIDLSNEAKGIYVLNVIYNNKLTSKKIIIE